jgi:protein-S-isoprenylcysteine O-methyltransferase Ste14
VLADVLDHHAAGWLALVIAALVAVLGVVGGRRLLHASPARRAIGQAERVRGSAAWWGRVLHGVATVLGLVAPLLVAADVIDPIALFDDPGLVVIGAGLALLGVALVLTSQIELRRAGSPDPVLASRGLRSRMRNPGLTGIVLATAGTLVMVPTLVGVLAAVLLVVSARIQVRAVREPMLAQLHGEEYLAYAARTGRYLPRLSPSRS